MDPEFSKDGLKVYWLYDDDNKRVGVVEHSADDTHTCLWYRNNVFSTLLQEDWSVYDETIWQLLSETAYDDCMRRGYTVNDLKAHTQALRIITPSDLAHKTTADHACLQCHTPQSKKRPGCIFTPENEKESLTLFDTLFVDEDDGTIYIPPGDSVVYATFLRRGAAAAAGAGAGGGAGAGAEAGGSTTPP